MGKESMIPLIREISNANGASGFEDEVLTVIRKYGKDLGEFSEDSLRNLYLRRAGNRGGRPVVQLDAHTDEVSFMVQAVKPNGTLVFIPLGGWVANNIPAHKVRVRNADGQYIPGVVASKPPHFMSEAERSAPTSPPWRSMSGPFPGKKRSVILRSGSENRWFRMSISNIWNKRS